VGPLPSAEVCIPGGARKKFGAALSAGGSQTVAGGTKTPRGAKPKQKTECPPGAERPRSGDRPKGGLHNADTLQTEATAHGCGVRNQTVGFDMPIRHEEAKSDSGARGGADRCVCSTKQEPVEEPDGLQYEKD